MGYVDGSSYLRANKAKHKKESIDFTKKQSIFFVDVSSSLESLSFFQERFIPWITKSQGKEYLPDLRQSGQVCGMISSSLSMDMAIDFFVPLFMFPFATPYFISNSIFVCSLSPKNKRQLQKKGIPLSLLCVCIYFTLFFFFVPRGKAANQALPFVLVVSFVHDPFPLLPFAPRYRTSPSMPDVVQQW